MGEVAHPHGWDLIGFQVASLKLILIFANCYGPGDFWMVMLVTFIVCGGPSMFSLTVRNKNE